MEDLLREFVETPGVAGDERPIRDLILGAVEDHVARVTEDDSET